MDKATKGKGTSGVSFCNLNEIIAAKQPESRLQTAAFLHSAATPAPTSYYVESSRRPLFAALLETLGW